MVLVGAGVRTDIEEFTLFEKLINVVHQLAPSAKICFNTGPTDSVDAGSAVDLAGRVLKHASRLDQTISWVGSGSRDITK